MTQRELNRAVSRATGETVSEIAHRGFGLADEMEPQDDSEDDEVSESDFLCWDSLHGAEMPRFVMAA